MIRVIVPDHCFVSHEARIQALAICNTTTAIHGLTFHNSRSEWIAHSRFD